jgi:hypothetical protein
MIKHPPPSRTLLSLLLLLTLLGALLSPGTATAGSYKPASTASNSGLRTQTQDSQPSGDSAAHTACSPARNCLRQLLLYKACSTSSNTTSTRKSTRYEPHGIRHAPPSRTLLSLLLLLTLLGALLSPGTATAGPGSTKLGQRVKPQLMPSELTTDSTKSIASALLIATCSQADQR